jgi:phosphatidylserine/phosphatidylglycerophosphate/cardiolipin synthase-like enzyme
MGKITKAIAICNNEVALIAWDVDGMIPGCVGFDITRIDQDTGEEKRLATWVPFDGQRNPKWLPQDTGVWPVQKTFWRDLTLRRRRDQATLRPDKQTVCYSIRPLGKLAAGGTALTGLPAVTYTGNPIPLTYIGAAVRTNIITSTSEFGDVNAAFTNGMLSGQWLKHAMEQAAKVFSVKGITDEINDAKSDIRAYLTGDVLGFLKRLVQRAHDKGGEVHLALYELADKELMDFLFANKDRIDLILSNTSADRKTGVWDTENQPVRDRYHQGGVKIQDRLFNNSHIGHNKFAVYSDAQGVASAVLLGSTNWTATGLCGQSNNAMIIENKDVAKAYLAYWTRLSQDPIPPPNPPGSAGKAVQVQGQPLRTANKTPVKTSLQGPAPATLWFSPNTKQVTRNIKTAPPDLADLFDAIAKAKQAVFFLAFLPSRAGLYSIIDQAVTAGKKNAKLLVVGAISDPTAMPNYQAKTDADGEEGDETPEQKAARSPYVYDAGHTHIVRASSLTSNDVVGDFEAEILKVGVAIVHDKIVVIDPMSDDCVVATGSHNLGYKASYENDENLVIIRGNKALAQAYTSHVYDVYDHYRFRAWQAQNQVDHKPNFTGNIPVGDSWLQAYVSGPKGDISAYLLGNALTAASAAKAGGTKPAPKKKPAKKKAAKKTVKKKSKKRTR